MSGAIAKRLYVAAGAFALVAVAVVAVQGDRPPSPAPVGSVGLVPHASLGKDAATPGPRVAEGAPQITMAQARARSTFALAEVPPGVVPGDDEIVRVLPQGTDAGEGFVVQYQTYELDQIPTDVPLDTATLLAAEFPVDLDHPDQRVARYHKGSVGAQAAVVGAPLQQKRAGVVVADAPGVVRWQVAAPAGTGAKFITYTVFGWRMDEARLLAIAQSIGKG